MVTVSQILQQKGSVVWSIDPDARVFDALTVMAQKDIGALVVTKDGRVVGILSERDYARKVALEGRSPQQTAVREIMTTEVVTVTPSQEIGECMALMTQRHVRHLPVADGGNLAGILSIGDIVKAIIGEQAETIRSLESYIHGTP